MLGLDSEAVRPLRSIQDRLWEKTLHQLGPDVCWPWLGPRMRQGYGSIWIRHGVTALTHRVAWELTYGPIPDGLCVMHTCDNPPCCNPAHLRLGTVADNNADKQAKGRAKSARGELNGHARITEGDVLEMRARRRAGEPNKSIAQSFGVPYYVVWGAVTGRTWKHLP